MKNGIYLFLLFTSSVFAGTLTNTNPQAPLPLAGEIISAECSSSNAGRTLKITAIDTNISCTVNFSTAQELFAKKVCDDLNNAVLETIRCTENQANEIANLVLEFNGSNFSYTTSELKKNPYTIAPANSCFALSGSWLSFPEIYKPNSQYAFKIEQTNCSQVNLLQYERLGRSGVSIGDAPWSQFDRFFEESKFINDEVWRVGTWSTDYMSANVYNKHGELVWLVREHKHADDNWILDNEFRTYDCPMGKCLDYTFIWFKDGKEQSYVRRYFKAKDDILPTGGNQ